MIGASTKYLVVGAAMASFSRGFVDDVQVYLDRYPALQAWLRRIAGLPGFVDDLQPYPANARLGAGRSIYD